MRYLATTDFLQEYAADLDPGYWTPRVSSSAGDLDPELAALRDEPYGLFAHESFDSVLARIQKTGADSFRVLVAGQQSPPVLRASLGPGPGLGALDARIVEELAIRTYLEKRDALGRLERALAAERVPEAIARAVAMACEECLLNAIFDAHPVLQSGERSDLFQLEAPIHFGFGLLEGLLVVRVRDPFGRFQHKDLLAAVMRRIAGGERRPSTTGLNAGLEVMLRHSNALLIDVEAGCSTRVYMVTDTTMRFRRFVKGGRVLVFLDEEQRTGRPRGITR